MLFNPAALPGMSLQAPLIQQQLQQQLPQQRAIYTLPGSLGNPLLQTSRKYIMPSTPHKSKYVASKPYTPTYTSTAFTNGMPSPPSGARSGAGVADTEDILICGRCKTLFRSMHQLTVHKRLVNCKPSCDCGSQSNSESPPLECATCHTFFTSCWSLCQHVQAEHGVLIYVEATNDTQSKEPVLSDSDTKTVSPLTESSVENGEAIENI